MYLLAWFSVTQVCPASECNKVSAALTRLHIFLNYDVPTLEFLSTNCTPFIPYISWDVAITGKGALQPTALQKTDSHRGMCPYGNIFSHHGLVGRLSRIATNP